MESVQPLGSVLQVDGRRYVVVGHRLVRDGDGVATGYLTVPYPLGFVGAESLQVLPASAVEAVVASAPDATDGAPVLPVGSVVRLQGAEALVMVAGYEPLLDSGWADYLGVPYPMGLVQEDAAVAFDADAVAEVVQRGLWDSEAEAGVAAVRRFRAATSDALHRVEELTASLTPSRVDELRMQYSFDALDDDPEPDFPM